MRKLFVYLKDYRRSVVFCLLVTVAEVVCELVIPLLMSKIVDVGIPAGDIGYMAKIGGIMVGVAAVAILMGVTNARLSAEASQGFAASVRSALYGKAQSFSFSNIDKFSSSSLTVRMTSDVTRLQMTMMMSLRLLTRAPIMLITAFIVAASINLRLSSLILVAVVLLVILVPMIAKAVGKLFALAQKKLDALNGTVQENLIAIRVVKAFVREGYERTKFREANKEYTDVSIRTGYITSLIMPVMMLILNGTTLSVLWFGGQFVGSDVMTIGQLISFTSYIMQILMSVMMFSIVFVMITQARASADRVVEVLDTQADILDHPQASQSSPRVTQGRVEFRDVCFRYKGSNGDSTDDTRDVLSHITFTAEPGEFVGIIGGTGSGKTSLVNLIPRFYDVTAGQILVDGADVRDYSQHALREGIGMVLQKNNLFSGTIRENLMWGNKDADQQAVEKAAQDAQAHQFISSFPQGYDTVLGQGGVNVSGGQKQRLCIARAMMKNPPILILDDSTSAVDTATEAKIRESFDQNLKDTTVLIVAQRISSVRHADKIIVLDDGMISAMGTHEELLQTSDVYREICMSQNEGSVA